LILFFDKKTKSNSGTPKKHSEMKTILITGASTGIGKSIGELLSNKGFTVFGTSRSPEKYPDSKFTLLAMDVRNHESIAAVASQIPTIDVLINNAGVGIAGALEEIPESEIKNNFEVNFFGPIAAMKAVLPTMRGQKSGLIINITSIAGFMGLPYRGVYSASKSALSVLSEAIAMEVKPFGISVCNVAPGDFATNIAAGRFHAPILAGSDYEDGYQKTLESMNTHVDSGENPAEMALAILKIIESRNPKIHYKIGSFMQKFSVVLKFILPDLVYQKMLMKHYGLA
jgi:short-subunit dehydrogenase